MEIKGNGPHIFRIPGGPAHMADGVLIDLVDGHVKADVARGSVFDVFHDEVIGVSPDGVVTIPVPVQAQKDQIGLREIQGKGSVGDHVDDEKAHALCLDHQVPEGDVPVPP